MPKIDKTKLRNSKIIGKGAFSTVWKYFLNNQETVAIKRRQLEWARSDQEENMKNLDHENVLKLVDEQQDEDKKFK